MKTNIQEDRGDFSWRQCISGRITSNKTS